MNKKIKEWFDDSPFKIEHSINGGFEIIHNNGDSIEFMLIDNKGWEIFIFNEIGISLVIYANTIEFKIDYESDLVIMLHSNEYMYPGIMRFEK